MTNTTKNKDEDELLETEEISEKIKESNEIEKKAATLPNALISKYTRPPAFQKSNNIGKGSFQTNNNRQRPGRAAGRGR